MNQEDIDMLDPADPPSPLSLRAAAADVLARFGGYGRGYWSDEDEDALVALRAALASSPAPDAGLRAALAEYRANESWAALARLLDACDAALASSPAPGQQDQYLASILGPKWGADYLARRASSPAPAGLDVEELRLARIRLESFIHQQTPTKTISGEPWAEMNRLIDNLIRAATGPAEDAG